MLTTLRPIYKDEKGLSIDTKLQLVRRNAEIYFGQFNILAAKKPDFMARFVHHFPFGIDKTSKISYSKKRFDSEKMMQTADVDRQPYSYLQSDFVVSKDDV